mgnify:FL=1
MRTYPPREKKILTPIETLYSKGKKICNECDHWEHEHEGYGMDVDEFIFDRECDICMCPMFKEATLEEAKIQHGELKPKITSPFGTMPKGYLPPTFIKTGTIISETVKDGAMPKNWQKETADEAFIKEAGRDFSRLV